MNNEVLLAEMDDLLKNLPNAETITHDLEENYIWFGRVAAVVEAWNSVKYVSLASAMNEINGVYVVNPRNGFGKVKTLLHQARHDLLMKTTGPLNVAFQKHMMFDYFDEVRKVIANATTDVFFVDPYLDADFVTNYLVHVQDGIGIRLLTSKQLATLLPAVELFNQQNGKRIEVRSHSGLHDRYLIVDDSYCYQSGASFKDGAKKSPTTLTQLTDVFSAVNQTYKDLWMKAKLEK